jgi:enterochelin esterase-like enzyme
LPFPDLIAKAREMGNPIIEGELVTFIWQGRTAPRLVEDVHNWEEAPQSMERVGPGLWTLSMRLAKNAYVEYGFINPKSGQRLPDPLNRKRIWNGINTYNNYFYMPHGGPNPLVQPVQGIPQGTLTHFQVPTKDYVLGTKRRVILYQPPVNEPVPLVVVFDGPDYLKLAKLNIIVDNMIAQKRVRPFAMAMIKDGGQARNLEYSCSDSTLGFVSECVIPMAQENLWLTPAGNGDFGIMGASLGGLMALYASLRLPSVFGKVLCQSGAFIFSEYESVVADLIRHIPAPRIEIWMDTGKYEWLLKGNQQMHALLNKNKFKVKYHEFSGGHNYTCWCNELWRGLEKLFRS